MLIKSVDLIVHQPLDREVIVLLVHLVQFIANLNELMLHRKEATADH